VIFNNFYFPKKYFTEGWAQWYIPVIPALREAEKGR
jgi:hypothetical protein